MSGGKGDTPLTSRTLPPAAVTVKAMPPVRTKLSARMAHKRCPGPSPACTDRTCPAPRRDCCVSTALWRTCAVLLRLILKSCSGHTLYAGHLFSMNMGKRRPPAHTVCRAPLPGGSASAAPGRTHPAGYTGLRAEEESACSAARLPVRIRTVLPRTNEQAAHKNSSNACLLPCREQPGVPAETTNDRPPPAENGQACHRTLPRMQNLLSA